MKTPRETWPPPVGGMSPTIFSLGTITAGGLLFVLAYGSTREAIVVPAALVALSGCVFSLYHRAIRRQNWSAAWDAYAEQDLLRAPTDVAVTRDSMSWAAFNGAD